ncbi:MAG: hypothetical protein R3F07_19865 [Opitutaceae bacterium]
MPTEGDPEGPRAPETADADPDPAAAVFPLPQFPPDSPIGPVTRPPVTTAAMSSGSGAGGEKTDGSSPDPGLFRPVPVNLPTVPPAMAGPVGLENPAQRNEVSAALEAPLSMPADPGRVPPRVLPAETGPEPGRFAAGTPEGATDAAGKVPIEPKAADIAGSTGVGTAGRNPVRPPLSNKKNFLPQDVQSVTDLEDDDGIKDALGGIRMRRPQDNPNPSIALASGRSRLTDGLQGLGEGRGGLRPTLNISSNPDLAKVEGLPHIDRAGFGGSSAESGSTTLVSTAVSTPSISGSRQADAVAVLENIHRLAEQAVAQGQNRLSMSLRLEDGGRIRIRLVRDGGEIHTLLRTDVPGLEAAFRQQWSQFSQDAVERGFRFQTLSFADPESSPGEDNHSHDGGRKTDVFNRESAPAASPLRVESASNGKSRQPAGLNPVPVPLRGAGRLRAWV